MQQLAWKRSKAGCISLDAPTTFAFPSGILATIAFWMSHHPGNGSHVNSSHLEYSRVVVVQTRSIVGRATPAKPKRPRGRTLQQTEVQKAQPRWSRGRPPKYVLAEVLALRREEWARSPVNRGSDYLVTPDFSICKYMQQESGYAKNYQIYLS